MFVASFALAFLVTYLQEIFCLKFREKVSWRNALTLQKPVKSLEETFRERKFYSNCAAVSVAKKITIEPWNYLLRHGLYRNHRTGEVLRVLDFDIIGYSQWSDAGEAFEVPGFIMCKVERGCENTTAQPIKQEDIFTYYESDISL
jgi:hypothetical protein